MFFEPSTNWHAPTPLQFTFEQQVNNILAMRKQNPRFKLATDYLTVAKELEAYTCARLGEHPKFCTGGTQKKTLATSSNPLPKTQVEDAADASVDPSALIEWLGAGARPVEQQLANVRASTCRYCPKNSKSEFCPELERMSWMSWITGQIASVLKKYSSMKHRMKLATPDDEWLGKCLACRCELPLKCWVPIGHIVDNMGPETSAAIAKVSSCWINTERRNGA